MSQFEIDDNMSFIFPEVIKTVYCKKKILVISPNTANWIVLESAEHLKIFEFLQQKHTIHEAIIRKGFSNEDVLYVVTQIIARRFTKNNTDKSSIEEDRNLHLYLTNACNLLCPHCYMFSGKALEDELTTDEILCLIKNYKNFANGHKLTISGGEPTIHPSFDYIVKYASNLGLEVKILTNGSLLSRERINRIAKYIHSVQISIDGFSEESNNKIRGKGHFQRAMDAIDNFIQHGVETSIAITPPYSLLLKHAKEYSSFAKKLSEKYSEYSFSVKFTEKLSSGRSVNLTKEQNKEYSKYIKQIQYDLYGKDYELFNFIQIIKNDVILTNCMFGMLSVTSNGDVYLCPEIGSLSPIANIKTCSFEEIIKRSTAASIATSVSNLKPCCDCELRFICGGGCRIEDFPNISCIKSFESVDCNSILPRECNRNIKDRFYDLMLQSNEYLFATFD